MLEKDNAELTAAIEFVIKDEVVLDRLGGRYVHPSSGRSYHIRYNPPKVPGKDDVITCSLLSHLTSISTVFENSH